MTKPPNPNFFFGVGSLLLYGAASFLYELFPGSSNAPDEVTITSFFGIQKNGDKWEYISERAPPGWKNRVILYNLQLTRAEIGKMYQVSLVSAFQAII